MKHQFRFKTPGKLIDAELELVLVEKRLADPKRNRSPCYVFEMRKSSGPIKIGTIRLRIDSTNTLRLPGHLGFDVKTRYRGHRYAARSCRLLLPLARAHSLASLWITCDPKNVASRRTCELAGASYVETVRIPKDHEMYGENERFLRRYRINLRTNVSNKVLRLIPSETRVGRPDRVHRMDAGWSPEAFKVFGLRGDK
jgi:predicted acetyltransferase